MLRRLAMVLRKLFNRNTDAQEDSLLRAARAQMPEADDETVRIVAAVAGLLAGIAYADREYAADEEERVRRALARVHGLTPAGIEAILSTLRAHIVEISTVQAPRYSRALLALGDRALRLEVLEMLLEVAAADDRITLHEVTLLRNTATALGLDQAEYNALQEKHRSRLSMLDRA